MFSVKQLSISAGLTFFCLFVSTLLIRQFSTNQTSQAVTPQSESETMQPSVAKRQALDSDGIIAALGAMAEQSKPTADEAAAAKLAAQAQQEAKVDKTLRPNFEAFDEEHQIGLVGIFADDEVFAVVQLINYASQQATYHRLAVNDELDGLTVATITDKALTMQGQGKNLSLTLFQQHENS